MQFNKTIFLVIVPLVFISHVAISMDEEVHSSDSTESHSEAYSNNKKGSQKKKRSGGQKTKTPAKKKSPLSCQWGQCTKTFQGKSAEEDRYNHWSKEHLSKIAHGTKLVVCRWKGCGHQEPVKMRPKEWLRAHCSREHLAYKSFICEGCGKHFQERVSLVHHQRRCKPKESIVVRDDEKFPCSYNECADSPIEYTSQKECFDHIQEHHFRIEEDADYKRVYPDVTRCHWAGCGFSVDTKLKTGDKKIRLFSHILIEHLKNFQAYECDFLGCEKKYCSVVSLRSHRKTHKKSNQSISAEQDDSETSQDDSETSEDGLDSELSDEPELSAYESSSENSVSPQRRPVTRQKRKLANTNFQEDLEESEIHKAKKPKKSKSSRDANNNSSALLPIELDDQDSAVLAEAQEITDENALIEHSHTQTTTAIYHAEEAMPLPTSARFFCAWNGCWQEFLSEQAMENHFCGCHFLVCEICNEGPFAGEDGLLRHITKNH